MNDIRPRGNIMKVSSNDLILTLQVGHGLFEDIRRAIFPLN